MPRGSKEQNSAKRNVAEGGYHLTSGDIARLLHVDLKTIHNWLAQGHIEGRRTEGRHLRFDRTEVVRFMRCYGYPLPESIGRAPPRIVLDCAAGSEVSGMNAWHQGLELTPCEGLYACALAAASGEQEIVWLDLDQREPKPLKEFVAALRAWPLSKRIMLAGVSKRPASRRAFLGWGGDASVPAGHEAELSRVALWMTGASATVPSCAELRLNPREPT